MHSPQQIPRMSRAAAVAQIVDYTTRKYSLAAEPLVHLVEVLPRVDLSASLLLPLRRQELPRDPAGGREPVLVYIPTITTMNLFSCHVNGSST